MTPKRRQPARGFTILEMLLAIAIMLTILAGLFGFYASSMRAESEAVKVGREAAVARELLQRMSEELRQVTGVIDGFAPSPMIGETNPPKITFFTRVLPDKSLMERRTVFDDQLPPQHDLRRISYSLLMDDEYTDENGDPYVFGIVREEEKTLLQEVEVEGDHGDETDEDVPPEEQFIQLDLYAPELKFLEFRYFDGANWVRRWRGGPGQSLPQAIRIVVGREPEYREDEEVEKITIDEDEIDTTIDFRQHPDRYVEIVRMTGADPFLGSRLVTATDTLGASE